MSTTKDDAQLEFDLKPPLASLPQLWTPDDIFNSCDEGLIRRFREDGRIERKPIGISQRLLAEYVSMWANTQPFGGVTFIGVTDDGKLAGCKNADEAHLNDLRAVRVLCHDARLEFKRVGIKNETGQDDFIEVMRVYYREDKLVETTSHEAFIREGDRKRRLTEEEKREIRLNKGELDVESERVAIKYPHDFNLELLKTYRNQYVAKRKLKDRFTIEDVLVLSKLGKRKTAGFEPNLGCTLLFANDPDLSP